MSPKYRYGCPVYVRAWSEREGCEVLGPCPKPLVEGGLHCRDHASKRDYR